MTPDRIPALALIVMGLAAVAFLALAVVGGLA